ncbi:MAG: hypothetical protein AB7G28_11035 [Pirellulales bacterium]
MKSGRNGYLAVLFSLIVVSHARGDEAAAAKSETVDPSGSWKWEYSFNDNPAEFMLELNWDGKQLTGKYTAFNKTTDIEETKFTPDNKISFLSKREFNGNQFTVHFDGEAKPTEIVGKVAVDFGQGPQEFDWTAKRVIAPEDVLGVWKLRLETERGVIEPQLTITKDGDNLKGHYESPFGEREAKELALKEDGLSWKVESGDDDQFQFHVTYKGQPRGNKISGSADFDFNGNTGTMEFTGERTPPQAEAATPQPAAQGAPVGEGTTETKPAAAAE